MPRSVTHQLAAPFEGIAVRVWERRTEGSMHAIAEGVHTYTCAAGNEHAITIEARWDIPEGAQPWHDLATRARDHDASAAQQLGAQMVEDAVHDEWDDPCEGRAA